MLDHQSYKMTSTSKIIEMLRNRRKYSRFNSESVENNLQGLQTYVFAHAKVKRSIFYSKILKFVPNIGIILNYLQSWWISIIKNWVWFTWVGNLGIPGIKPYNKLSATFLFGKLDKYFPGKKTELCSYCLLNLSKMKINLTLVVFKWK